MFVCGNSLTIADFVIFCELQDVRVLQRDMTQYSAIKRYVENVMANSPGINQIHREGSVFATQVVGIQQTLNVQNNGQATQAASTTKAATAPAPAQKLIYSYFNIYGRGEPARMMWAHCGFDYVDDRINQSDWGKLKNSKFGGSGLPVITRPDGIQVNQSIALFMFIARRHGYYPTDPEVQLEHDWLVENYTDILGPIFGALSDKDPVSKKAKCDKLFDVTLPAWIQKILKYLRSPGKFLFGDKLTLADFLVGRVYTDYFTNALAGERLAFTNLLTLYPEFDTYGKRFTVEMGDYLVKRPACSF